jgi:hypothetical protein
MRKGRFEAPFSGLLSSETAADVERFFSISDTISASVIVAVVLEPLQHLLLDDGGVEKETWRERKEEGGRQGVRHLRGRACHFALDGRVCGYESRSPSGICDLLSGVPHNLILRERRETREKRERRKTEKGISKQREVRLLFLGRAPSKQRQHYKERIPVLAPRALPTQIGNYLFFGNDVA